MRVRWTPMTRLVRWLDRIQPDEAYLHGGAALLVGLASGAGVWLFKELIDWVHAVAFDGLGGALEQFGAWTVMLLPVIGGLIVGLISQDRKSVV